MKKLLIALTIATTLPFTVQANDTSSALEFCKPIHSLAETIMKRRQEGASMVEMLGIANSANMESIKTLANSMVKDAYDSPRFHTKENQHRATQDFANDMFMKCMKIAEGL